MRTREGILLNVVVGIVGTALGSILKPARGGLNHQSNFRAAGLLVSFVGGVMLLAIVNRAPKCTTLARVRFTRTRESSAALGLDQRTPATKSPYIG